MLCTTNIFYILDRWYWQHRLRVSIDDISMDKKICTIIPEHPKLQSQGNLVPPTWAKIQMLMSNDFIKY